ncbi:unnamed protein product [Didymodactylos carnosus]|uniref:RRM domain-containing protein n=1 Tax=Didymodactylos carnosus TaxID=1234261 RepID=A0A814MQI2_9BILA|nr:unnamed protein product [Didymodactylos carnosus]CAF1121855.1 unnamed protein product [Didymodactylos carnosus]CAF3848815.1 unnamed protein product [Didymodactylos carnosus]CAF3896274.1 unnamed protein product [Didymodactylos carnosus]
MVNINYNNHLLRFPMERSRSRSRSSNRHSRSSYSPELPAEHHRGHNRQQHSSNNSNNIRHDYNRLQLGGRIRTNDRQQNPARNYSDHDLGLKYRWEKTVFVSNIPYDVRWATLKDLFRTEVGEVMYTEIFERNGKSLGCGSIEFRTIDEAKRAVEKMHQYEFNGRKLSVKLDEEGYRTRRSKYQALEGKLSQKNTSLTSNSLLSELRPNISSLPTNQVTGLSGVGSSLSGCSSLANIPQHVLQRLGIEGPITNKVFVANLDFRCDENKVREIFALAGRIRNITLKKTKEGASRGMAIVEYEHPLEAIQAVSMFNEQQLLDRNMAVKIDSRDMQDDSKPMKLPSGLKTIGAGLGIGGNLLRDVNSLSNSGPIEPSLPQLNQNLLQTLSPSVSDYINHNDLSALNMLSQLSPSALSVLSALTGSLGNNALSALASLQSTTPGLNSSLGTDSYSSNASLLGSSGHSSLGFSGFSGGLASGTQLSSAALAKFYNENDNQSVVSRIGQQNAVTQLQRSSHQTQSNLNSGRLPSLQQQSYIGTRPTGGNNYERSRRRSPYQ